MAARNFIQRADPLTLDLDGDGLETVASNSGITFDFDGDGLKTGTGWVGKDDGFLVLDRNNNGRIDTGAELFGVDTLKRNGQKATNGFDALRDLDSNNDGIFNASDAQFANVRVWQDVNQDGISQANELRSLADQHIQAIELTATGSNLNQNGNLISAVGSYTRDDGGSGQVNGNQSLAGNLDLVSNPFYREYTDHVTLDDVAKGLPDMHGSGAVRDLREASMLNGGLKGVLAEYASAQTREQQMALIDRLLTEWAKSSTYRTFDQRISDLGTGTFDVEFGWSWETGGGFGVGGGSTSNASPIGPGTSGPTQEQLAQKALLERVKLLEVFNAQNFFNFSSQVSTTSKGDEFTISPSAGMNGVVGASAVAGGSITLTEKNLTLNLGQAAFINSAYESLRQSVYNGLLLQTRLRPYVEAIGVTLNGNGLGLDFSAVATLFQKAFAASHINGLVDLWEFLGQPVGGQGVAVLGSIAESFAQSLTSAEVARINALGLGVQVGTVSRQNLVGTAGNDVLLGLAGNGTLSGGDGNDTLSGGIGNDWLFGDAGNDVLVGGTGNDLLSGDAGNDVYRFERGWGQDTVSNYDDGIGRVDTLEFAAGIALSDIQLSRADDSLVLALKGSSDRITVESYFYNDAAGNSQLDKIRFADGTALDVAQVKRLVQQGTSGNDTLYGYAVADTLNGGVGNDYLYGNAGNDRLEGGDGNDALYGGDGNDTLLGGAGGDTFDGQAGNDSMQGGEGNDYLYGSDGNDTLSGGTGNDYLSGDAGNDVYRFERGWGQDTVSNYEGGIGRVDTLEFSAGIAVSDIQLSRADDSLVLALKGSTDRITVESYFYNDAAGNSQLDKIRFADGTALDVAQVKRLVQQGTSGNDTLYGYAVADTLNGGVGNDYLYGNAGNDRLEGGDGNDALYGGDGNDTLLGGAGGDTFDGQAGNDSMQGGEGNDYLYGSDGNDTLSGGTGNDYLSGDAGNDVYRFDRNFGQDVISNYHTETNTLDQLVFADNITANQLWFRKNGNDLDISVIGTTDKVSVSDWYSGSNYHLNQVVSADGKTLLESQVQNLVNAMAAFGVPAGGESSLTPNQRQQLDVVLAANWQ